jgi:hypothetical protein
MANYYCTARSNYFRVRDYGEFCRVMSQFPDVSVHEREEDGTVCLLAESGDGWPAGYFDEHDEWNEVMDGFPHLVADHLAPGWVAVFMEAGAEKLRYVSGSAVAINAEGEHRQVVLSDIYVLAAELGEHVTPAEY